MLNGYIFEYIAYLPYTYYAFDGIGNIGKRWITDPFVCSNTLVVSRTYDMCVCVYVDAAKLRMHSIMKVANPLEM